MATPRLSSEPGSQYAQPCRFAPGLAFVVASGSIVATAAYSYSLGVTASLSRGYVADNVFSYSLGMAASMDGGAPTPPSPPSPPPLTCEVPPAPGYSALYNAYDEPSERIGS